LGTAATAYAVERALDAGIQLRCGCYQVPLSLCSNSHHHIGVPIRFVRASPRKKMQRGSYPSAPLILPPGSKVRSNCPIIHTHVERDSVSPHRMAECAQKSKGPVQAWESGGLVSVFRSTRPNFPGKLRGSPGVLELGEWARCRCRLRCCRRFLVSRPGGEEIPISGHRSSWVY